MVTTPIDAKTVRDNISKSGLESVGLASVRECNRLVLNIEKASGQRFIRVGMGSPTVSIDSH